MSEFYLFKNTETLNLEKKYDEALAECDNLISKNTNSEAMQLEKANLLNLTGKKEEALELYNKFLEGKDNTEYLDIFFKKIKIIIELSQFEKAIEVLEKVIKF